MAVNVFQNQKKTEEPLDKLAKITGIGVNVASISNAMSRRMDAIKPGAGIENAVENPVEQAPIYDNSSVETSYFGGDGEDLKLRSSENKMNFTLGGGDRKPKFGLGGKLKY